MNPAAEIKRIAEVLLNQDCQVVICQSGLKVPLPRTPAREPFGEVTALTNVSEVDSILETGGRFRSVNIGAFLGPQRDSQLALGDVDGQTGLDLTRRLGVNSRLRIWISLTGSSRRDDPHLHFFFRHPTGIRLPRRIRPSGLELDLLVDGYAIIPPSDTGFEPKGGGLYRWAPGHSPFDIPIADLDEPPRKPEKVG